MVALHLQIAYFHIPVLQVHQRYLRFTMGQEHFQFAVLPFGLTSAPLVFTKVMAVVAAHLQRSGVPVFPYFDDWLQKAGLPQVVLTHVQTKANLLTSLGFTIPMFQPRSWISVTMTLQLLGLMVSCILQRYFFESFRIQYDAWGIIKGEESAVR